jgi:hypothetical protein
MMGKSKCLEASRPQDHSQPKNVEGVLTPIFHEQLALNEYWKQIGGTVMLLQVFSVSY